MSDAQKDKEAPAQPETPPRPPTDQEMEELQKLLDNTDDAVTAKVPVRIVSKP